MTAATITPADIAAEAHAVLDIALTALKGRLDRPARRAIGGACRDLDEALNIYDWLASGALHWEAVYPELSDAINPHDEALIMAAQEAESRAETLARAIARHRAADAPALITTGSEEQ